MIHHTGHQKDNIPQADEREKQKINFIESTIRNSTTIIDATSFSHTNFDMFWDTIFTSAQKYRKSINIPCFEYETIKSEFQKSNILEHDEENRYTKISKLINDNKLKLYGLWSPAANCYKDIFYNFSKSSAIEFCIFVQNDNKLAEIKRQMDESGINPRQVAYCKITHDGYAQRLSFNDLKTVSNHAIKQNNFKPEMSIIEPKFSISRKIYYINSKKIVTNIPVSSETVRRSDGEAISLLDRKFFNVDSVTYRTNKTQYYAKIYNLESINAHKYEKSIYMTNNKISIPGVSWPIDALYNEFGEFVGTLIPPIKGYPLHLSVFKTTGLSTYFPHWQRVDIATLAATIIEKIEKLHRENILLGCINPASILVADQNTVHFTDTDQYQIEGFPCLRRNVTFMPPEFQKRQDIFLIEKQNEFFAVAVLAFMILLPGKAPYERNLDEDISDTIIKMKFPYAYGKQHSENVPPGFWRFVWSHLFPELKKVFFHTFRYDGQFSSTANRKNTATWLDLIKSYQQELTTEKTKQYDSNSLKLFPTTFRRSQVNTLVSCILCGQEYRSIKTKSSLIDDAGKYDPICHECWSTQTAESFKCKGCGKQFYYSKGELYIRKKKQFSPQRICNACKGKKYFVQGATGSFIPIK